MDITPFIPKTKLQISGYGAGGFKINQERIEGSIIVCDDFMTAWAATNFETIDYAALLENLPQNGIELLLIGTGTKMHLLPAIARELCKVRKLAVEAMDTGAACRTYNVLASEERRVAAALIAV